MIPFATKKFWNSSKKFSTHSVNHSPLADAIMVGNFEMVKAIMPYTKIKANPKRRFGSYLHVAVKYGQFESFKFIVQEMKKKKFDWLKLKDQENRSAYEFLTDENFRVELYDPKLGKPFQYKKEESDKYKQHMQKFIETFM